MGTQTTQTTLTTSWQAVTVTYTPLNPTTSSLDLNIYVSSLAPTTSFYADDVSVVLRNANPLRTACPPEDLLSDRASAPARRPVLTVWPALQRGGWRCS